MRVPALLPRPSRRVLRLYVKLRRATGGVAAVEFSLLLPLMLMLYLGSAETTQAVMSGRKAREKMDAGADAVQLYTGLIYRGPALVGECVRAVAR